MTRHLEDDDQNCGDHHFVIAFCVLYCFLPNEHIARTRSLQTTYIYIRRAQNDGIVVLTGSVALFPAPPPPFFQPYSNHDWKSCWEIWYC